MVEEFRYEKPIDKSLFKQGFAVPIELHGVLAKHLSGGRLEVGEKRPMKFFLEGIGYDVSLRNENFDRKKNPTHGEIWQFNYGARSPIACRLREIFSSVLSPTFKPLLNAKLIVRSTAVSDQFRIEPVIGMQTFDKQLSMYFYEVKERSRLDRYNERTDELDGDCPWAEIFIEQLLF